MVKRNDEKLVNQGMRLINLLVIFIIYFCKLLISVIFLKFLINGKSGEKI